MNKASITTKILRAFLLVCASSLIVSSIITMVSLFNIRKVTMESSNQIGALAADDSAESLLNQALSDLGDLTEAKSEIIDLTLWEVYDCLEMLKGYIEEIYRNPQEFRSIRIPNYRDVPSGQTQLHWFFDARTVPNPQYNENDLIRTGILGETYLLGNLERVNQLVIKAIPDISSIYLSTKSGLNIQYDADAALKVQESGFTSHERSWYTAARDRNESYISEAYDDFAGRGLTVTMSTPYYGKAGEFMGVVGIDIRIKNLDKLPRETVVGTNGYALLLNNNAGEDGNQCKIISAPGFNPDNEIDIEFFLGGDMNTILADMKTMPSGVGHSTLLTDGRATKVYIVWAPVGLTNWQLVYVVPESDILAPSVTLRNEIIRMTADATKRVNALIYTAIGTSGALLLLIILLTLWAAHLIARGIARPITILTENVKKIGNGNLEYHSEIKTGDEIEELSLSFENMSRELQHYIENLSHVTTEKERIGAELNVATKIQASMLPRIFPAFPDRKEFDIYASMLPAKEVAGDFYDFFLIDKDTLVILIADVSGKGVPAALFMVIAKTLIKNNALYNMSPKEVFETVNNLLCVNNEEGMFVTVFMAYLDIPTGKFTCVNAGHNPPLIKQGDDFGWLKIKPGLVLGGMEDMRYNQEELTLRSGDEVYLYTDGVTEAMNPRRELFTDPRLLNAANVYKDLDLKGFAVSIKSEIDKFAEGAKQADDITMLVLKYRGEQ